MSFWDNSAWIASASASPPVIPFDPTFVDDAKYKLAIGPEVYISTGEGRNTIGKLQSEDCFVIKPGEFAFIITEEELDIPLDCLGFISMSTKIKFNGLVNVSGFHVDPGYKGRLIFAVFNAGPKKIHLQRGERVFSLWLAALSAPNTSRPNTIYRNITPEIVNRLEGNFLTAYQLSEKNDELEKRIHSLETSRTRFWASVVTVAVVALGTFSFIFQDPVWELITSIPRQVDPINTQE